jgi:hypothetical protein
LIEQPPNDNGWLEYRRLILAEIERINRGIQDIGEKLERLRSEDLNEVKIDIAMLQVKSGAWGALAGLCVALGGAVLKYATGH